MKEKNASEGVGKKLRGRRWSKHACIGSPTPANSSRRGESTRTPHLFVTSSVRHWHANQRREYDPDSIQNGHCYDSNDKTQADVDPLNDTIHCVRTRREETTFNNRCPPSSIIPQSRQDTYR